MSTDMFDQDCRGLKVLVVDDKSINRDLIKKILIDEGLIVVGEARDGEEATSLYEALKPDLVTMDINMPNVNGLRAIKKIMQIDSNAKIIVVSGYQNSEDKAREFGAKDFLAKPFQPAFLINKIKKLVEDGAFGEVEDPQDETIIDISVSPENQEPTQGVKKKKKQMSPEMEVPKRKINTGPRSPESIILSDDDDDDEDDLLAAIDFDTGEGIEILDIRENMVFMIDDDEDDDMFIDIPPNIPEVILKPHIEENLIIDEHDFITNEVLESKIDTKKKPDPASKAVLEIKQDKIKKSEILVKPPRMNPLKEEDVPEMEDLIIHPDDESRLKDNKSNSTKKEKQNKQPDASKEKKGLFGLFKKNRKEVTSS